MSRRNFSETYHGLQPYATTPRQKEYLEAILRHGSQRAAAREVGVNPRTLERALEVMQRRATKAGDGSYFLSNNPLPPGLKLERTTTLMKRGEPEPLLQWVRGRADSFSAEEFVQMFAESIGDRPIVPKLPKSRLDSKDLMVTFIMPEPHIGMLAWAEECGEDYDMKIARGILSAGVRHLVQKVGRHARFLLLDGGDYFHYSSRVPETEKHRNQLSADGRWQKVIQTGIEVYIDTIDHLAANCQKLDVVRVPGNHDPDWSLWLDNCLSQAYKKSKSICIDTQPKKAKCVTWGEVFIATDHGEGKMRDFCEFAAAEWPEAWGRSSYRYVWTGHVHHKVVEEHRGVTSESINSIAARDDFHTSNKFRSLRSMLAVVYHRQYGEVARHIFRPGMMVTGK